MGSNVTQSFKKDNLRNQFKDLRGKFSEKYIKVKSLIIADNFFNIEEIRNNLIFALYLPINREVETKGIIDKLAQDKKKICLPKFLDKKWILAEFTKWEHLEKGPFSIYQPLSSDTIDPIYVDVAVLPALAFDKSGNRLGYGTGVYDRLFANSKAICVGLGLEEQIINELPSASHDLKMNFVVTDKQILRF